MVRVIWKRALERLGVKIFTGFKWLRMGPVVGSCKHSSEPSDSVKGSNCSLCTVDWIRPVSKSDWGCQNITALTYLASEWSFSSTFPICSGFPATDIRSPCVTSFIGHVSNEKALEQVADVQIFVISHNFRSSLLMALVYLSYWKFRTVAMFILFNGRNYVYACAWRCRQVR